MSFTALNISTFWDAPAAVRAPELAATWAKVRISSGDMLFTRVLDKRAETVREDVYFPLYPLAEWIACNWFFLLHEVPNPRKQTPEVERRHNIRSGREGFAFPSLSIWPEGENTCIRATRFAAEDESVEYLVEGEAKVSSDDLRKELVRFIDLVCERLISKGISDSLLQEEWDTIQKLDQDENDFCAACARLGQDPFNMDDSDIENVLNAASLLSENMQGDFFEAADLGSLSQQLNYLKRYLRDIEKNTADVKALKKLRERPLVKDEKAMPWEQGYEAARRLREILSLNGHKLNSEASLQGAFSLQPAEWRACFLTRKNPAPFFDSLIGLNQIQSPVFIVPQRKRETMRFSFCRALFEYLTSQGPALTNSSHSCRQKRNRAFAAEFLAPSAAIKEELRTDFADEDTIASLAGHFGVSEYVIEHQIMNHCLAQTATHVA